MNNRPHKKDMVEQLQADREVMANWKGDQGINQNVFGTPWLNLFIVTVDCSSYSAGIINWFEKKIKDDQFIGSVKVALGIFLVPINYLLLTTAFYIVTKEPLWTAGFFVSLPLSGLIAYNR